MSEPVQFPKPAKPAETPEDLGRVLLAGWPGSPKDELTDRSERIAWIRFDPASGIGESDLDEIALVCIGPDFDPDAQIDLVRAIRSTPSNRLPVVLAGAPADAAAFFELERVYHLERQTPSSERLASVVEEALEATRAAAQSTGDGLYRRAAVDAEATASRALGEPIFNDPSWAKWSFRILPALFGVFLALGSIAPVPHYSEGPAIIRAADRSEATAMHDGTIEEIVVERGETVESGQLLVRLHGPGEKIELLRQEQEFLLLLRSRLQNPASSELELIRSRTNYELARRHLAEREIRATAPGVVRDILIEPGQFVEAGTPVLLTGSASRGLVVSALLPGQDRPALSPDQPLLLELDGYSNLSFRLKIREISSEAVAGSVVSRSLGSTLAEVLHLDGSVVLVTADLDIEGFESHGQTYRFRDGMPGHARVKTHSEPVIFELVPGLERLFQTHEEGSGDPH